MKRKSLKEILESEIGSVDKFPWEEKAKEQPVLIRQMQEYINYLIEREHKDKGYIWKMYNNLLNMNVPYKCDFSNLEQNITSYTTEGCDHWKADYDNPAFDKTRMYDLHRRM